MPKRVSPQVGWSVDTKLLYEILKQLEQLTKVVSTLTTTTTTP